MPGGRGLVGGAGRESGGVSLSGDGVTRAMVIGIFFLEKWQDAFGVISGREGKLAMGGGVEGDLPAVPSTFS